MVSKATDGNKGASYTQNSKNKDSASAINSVFGVITIVHAGMIYSVTHRLFFNTCNVIMDVP